MFTIYEYHLVNYLLHNWYQIIKNVFSYLVHYWYQIIKYVDNTTHTELADERVQLHWPHRNVTRTRGRLPFTIVRCAGYHYRTRATSGVTQEPVSVHCLGPCKIFVRVYT